MIGTTFSGGHLGFYGGHFEIYILTISRVLSHLVRQTWCLNYLFKVKEHNYIVFYCVRRPSWILKRPFWKKVILPITQLQSHLGQQTWCLSYLIGIKKYNYIIFKYILRPSWILQWPFRKKCILPIYRILSQTSQTTNLTPKHTQLGSSKTATSFLNAYIDHLEFYCSHL